MNRYVVSVDRGRVTDVQEFLDDDEEPLGIEWALSELKDSYRHSKKVDGSYSLAGKGELAEFLTQLERLLGAAALAEWRTKYGNS